MGSPKLVVMGFRNTLLDPVGFFYKTIATDSQILLINR